MYENSDIDYFWIIKIMGIKGVIANANLTAININHDVRIITLSVKKILSQWRPILHRHKKRDLLK